jgi:hypothetical protein
MVGLKLNRPLTRREVWQRLTSTDLMVRCFARGEASNHAQQAQRYDFAPFEASLRDAPQGEVC